MSASRQPWDDEVVSIVVLTLVKVNSCIVFHRTLVIVRDREGSAYNGDVKVSTGVLKVIKRIEFV